MDRLATAFGVLGLGVALGALAVGELVVADGLSAQTRYVDPNLAMTLTAPLHLACAAIVLGACLVLALAVPRWIDSRVATTTALCAVGCAAAYRLALLPKIYAAWSQVDLVAGRPAPKIEDAIALANNGSWLAAITGMLLLGLVGLAAWSSRAVRPVAAAQPTAAPTAAPSPAPASAVAA